MLSPHKKRIIIAVIGVVLLGVGVFAFLSWHKTSEKGIAEQSGSLADNPKQEVIGTSVQRRAIDAYTYGNGKTRLLLVGGIHGGYEWNSVLLAYAFMDYLDTHPEIIPSNLSVTIIPSANPDGLFKVIGKGGRFTVADVLSSADQSPGRFNANGVDLNRNFDCRWQSNGVWQWRTVSAGTVPFSEPESRAIRDFVLRARPAIAVFWHSQSNAVYASQCEKGILSETIFVMNAYSKAARYSAVKVFDAYATTGAADDWMASINIPAITVELKTRDTIEWDKNLAGIKALLDYYRQK